MIAFLEYKFNQEEHIQKILCPFFKIFVFVKYLVKMLMVFQIFHNLPMMPS